MASVDLKTLASRFPSADGAEDFLVCHWKKQFIQSLLFAFDFPPPSRYLTRSFEDCSFGSFPVFKTLLMPRFVDCSGLEKMYMVSLGYCTVQFQTVSWPMRKKRLYSVKFLMRNPYLHIVLQILLICTAANQWQMDIRVTAHPLWAGEPSSCDLV